MRMRKSGFTLIEIMIVLTIIATVVAIAVPNLIRSRIAANETAAIAACKIYADAQEIYHRTDYTGNGALKYATALSGVNSLFGPTGDLALIDKSFANAEGLPGVGSPKTGYVFTILTGQGASASGGVRNYVVSGNMTLGYGMSALPAGYGTTGYQTFIINAGGVVFETDQGAAGTYPPVFDPTSAWVPAQ